MTGRDHAARGALVAVVLLGIALRVFLTGGLPTFPARLPGDDALFPRLAEHVAHGGWLGPYDRWTLVKGCGYPLFLAGARLLGLPRRPAETLLLVGACLALLLALRRLGVGRALAGAAFLLVLLSPAFSSTAVYRSLRENVYGAQVVLVFACALGVLAARRPLGRGLAAVACGTALAFLDVTREEGLWIAPALGVLLLAWIARERRSGRSWPAALGLAALLALPAAALPAAATALVRAENERHYGVAVDVAFEEPGFVSAVAALNRVAAAEWRPGEPLGAEAWERLHAASPALAELRPHLEAAPRGPVTAPGGALLANYRMWALRDAAAAAGHHRSAPAAAAFYRRLAAEVEEAVRAGRLPAAPPRGGVLPALHPELHGELAAETAGRTADALLQRCPGAHFGILLPDGGITRAEVERLRRRLGEPPWPVPGLASRARFRLLHAAHEAWGALVPFVLAAGVAGLTVLLLRARRGGLPWLLVVAAPLVALGTRSFLVSVLHVYWFPTGGLYLLCALPLAPLAALLAVHGGLRTLPAPGRTARALVVGAGAGLAGAAGFAAASAGAAGFGPEHAGVPLRPFRRLPGEDALLALSRGRVLPGPGPGLDLRVPPGGRAVRLTVVLRRHAGGDLELRAGFPGAARGLPFQVRARAPAGPWAGRWLRAGGPNVRTHGVAGPLPAVFELEVRAPGAAGGILRLAGLAPVPPAPR